MHFIYLTALLIPLKTPKMKNPPAVTSLVYYGRMKKKTTESRVSPVSEEQEQEPQRLGLGRQFHEHQQSMVSYRTDADAGETMISNLWSMEWVPAMINDIPISNRNTSLLNQASNGFWRAAWVVSPKVQVTDELHTKQICRMLICLNSNMQNMRCCADINIHSGGPTSPIRCPQLRWECIYLEALRAQIWGWGGSNTCMNQLS